MRFHYLLFTLAVCATFTSQLTAQLTNENTPSATTQTGFPPYSTGLIDRETVSPGTGALNIYVPLLTIPGRGGQAFSLGLSYDSHAIYAMVETTQASIYQLTGPQPRTPNPPIYTASWASLSGSAGRGLALTIPRLQAAIAPIGVSYNYCNNNNSNTAVTVFATQNFIFIDEIGTSHVFTNYRDVSQTVAYSGCTGQFFYPVNITDALDGSYMRLDTTNPNDMVVTTKSGTKYHFGNLPIIANSQTTGGPSQPYFYNGSFTNKVDVHGNTITYANGVIKTDLGQTITFDTTGALTYSDSNGNKQTIVIGNASPLDNPPATVSLGSVQCTRNDNAYIPNSSSIWQGSDGQLIFSSATSVKLPSGDIYSFYTNNLGELYRISYPSGGYSTYSYSSFGKTYNLGGVTCSGSQIARQITSKNAYISSNRSPATTTYLPTGDYVEGQGNSTNDVTDPNGYRTRYTFVGPNRESERDMYSGSHLLKTVQTTYTQDNNSISFDGTSYGTSLPDTVTTTLQDVSPPLVSKVHYVYDTINLLSRKLSGGVSYIDNPIEIDEYDYGATKSTRVQTFTWMKGGIFDIASGHVLDKPNTSAISGDTISRSITYSYYPSSSNLESTSTTGSGLQNAIVEDYQYDGYGNISAYTDPNKNITQYSYTASWFDSNCPVSSTASPAQSSTTNAANQKVAMTYYTCTGLLAQSKDANGTITQYEYDLANRPAKITRAFGAVGASSTTFSYPNGTQRTIVIDKDKLGDGAISTTNNYDGLGRLSSTIDASGATIDFTYDLIGNVLSQSNPYRSKSDTTYGFTVFAYDALGRKLYQCQPDNDTGLNACVPGTSYLQWSYAGNLTIFKDEVGDQWKRNSDAFGRLTQVVEPDGLTTTYQYDTLNNLKCVDQWGIGTAGNPCTSSHARGFSYDSLSRLITSTNPETGTICYGQWSAGSCANGYDGNGNLLHKTDARGTIVNYSYDALNRLLSKTYTNASGQSSTTPSSCYQYDQSTSPNGTSIANPIGRLTSEWTQIGACASQRSSTGFLTSRAILAYDPMGRIKSEQQCTPANCTVGSPYQLNYSYDLAGNVTLGNNGIGSVSWQPQYDAAGRLQTVTGTTPWRDPQYPTQLFNATTYGPVGLTDWIAGGSSSANPALTFHRDYDSRLRMSGQTVTGHH